jgi:hypothetical protein
MSDRIERDARWIRLAVWSGALVLLAVTGAITVNVMQANRLAAHREAAAMAAVKPAAPARADAPARPVDYDAYERANAERNREQIAREEAAYEAYRTAQAAAKTPKP